MNRGVLASQWLTLNTKKINNLTEYLFYITLIAE
jgi:hypothetical protein